MASEIKYIYVNTKLEGESLGDWTKEWKNLTESDQAELREEAAKYQQA